MSGKAWGYTCLCGVVCWAKSSHDSHQCVVCDRIHRIEVVPDDDKPAPAQPAAEDRLVDRADRVHGMVHRMAVAELRRERERATRLADEAGALRTQLRDAEATIGRLTQRIERLERAAKKGGGR